MNSKEGKKEKIKPDQLDVLNLIKNSFSSCATISYQNSFPENFERLEVSPSRGGKVKEFDITFSVFNLSRSKLVLGVRILDEKGKLLKEDHIEYNLETKLMRKYSKGRYEIENPLYKNTHHITL